MSAGPLFNTETTVGFSGLGRSVINFYGDQHTNVSGAGTQVASGAGVLFDVITYLSSGIVAAPASNSGAIIWVFDAISGITNPQASGNGIFYNFVFGSQSGTGTGGVPILPPDLTGLAAVFKSGLNVIVSGAAGVGITVVYSKAV